ncbi:PhnE/PtxC family ABC transporter permease [Engelhardtia mirabilis]|uniref:Phosphate-import permease protein PhnE n=1 Tax=Engelhardtia mirabilis TaxID=2528011 RepID=A0A518BNL9_9BACT|nr:Phosphate-import permease protein PhnE [Planctomycetes bacterium Pla133]QDV02904.1 Phosphate-import permease protein PhnE [Planctomycetes bacterium Pla86]
MSDARDAELDRMRRQRPRDRFARATALLLFAFGAGAWLSGALRPGELFGSRQQGNLRRFLFEELPPAPLRGDGASWSDWFGGLLGGRGIEAALAGANTTFWIAALAIVLAATGGALAAPFAARTLARPDPYGRADAEHPSRARTLTAAATALRFLLVLARAMPEYVLAYLGLAVFGFTVWPLVFALALHNCGILGRLGAETIENLDPTPMRQLRLAGASRAQMLAASGLPAATPNYLLYVFYRFETCVREATVLGLLGVASLGYWIEEARIRAYYDELVLLILLAMVLVLLAEVASTAARAWIRRSG